MTDAELVSNCDLLIIARSETKASLLSSITYWLLKTPRALKKVTEKVPSTFQRKEDMTSKKPALTYRTCWPALTRFHLGSTISCLEE
jgi:cytochrome P450